MADADDSWAQYVAPYTSGGAVPSDASMVTDAIAGFLLHRGSGLAVQDAAAQAVVDAARRYASAWRAVEQTSPDPPSYDPNTVPGLPAVRGHWLAEDAINRFLDHQGRAWARLPRGPGSRSNRRSPTGPPRGSCP